VTNFRRRRIVFALVAFAVVAVLLLGAIAGVRSVRNLFLGPADYHGSGFGSVVVQVHEDDSLRAIGADLQSAGVVASADAFANAASGNSRAASIGPGYYRLRKHMKASLALALILEPDALVTSRIVVPEGMRLRDILQRIATGTHLSLASLQAVARSPQALGVPSWGRGHPLEGFLFPATYDFPPGTTATQALAAMVRRFDQAAADVKLKAAHGLSAYGVLTLASIIQREGRLTSDFAKIAEVFDNRLSRGMALGSDATLFYALPPNHGPLTSSDLHLDSPYNTRLHTGLPPTPIASPGEDALRAALHPAHGPYLYFVTIDKAGHAAFATTLQEFNHLVAISRSRGVQ
jgi:UPF0755 protein